MLRPDQTHQSVGFVTILFVPGNSLLSCRGTASKQGSQRSSGTSRHRGFSPGRPQSACGQNREDGFHGMSKIPWGFVSFLAIQTSGVAL